MPGPVYAGRSHVPAVNYGIWRDFHQPDHHHHYHNGFYHAVNYAYRPRAWGIRTWWAAPVTYSWHSGCWDYHWNGYWTNRYAYYQRPSSYYPPGYRVYYTGASSVIPWGLASWTLGRLAYDTGYYSYSNPYAAPPVTTHTTLIQYSEPIAVVASRDVPRDEELVKTGAEKSAAAMERARNAFRTGDYVGASKAVDEAISHAPGDPVLHEFRALVLFALGRYNDAAGVLNSVLASGPGWNWETLIGFYGAAERYTGQLRKLEEYATAHPDSPEPHFLLGYHYLVGGNLPEAHGMFSRVVELQPADTVASQLRGLLAESAADKAPDEGAAPAEATTLVEADKEPIRKEALVGIWKAASAEGKTVTLSMTAIGTFTWDYEGAAGKVLAGDWSLDENGLLVLKDDEVQMVGDIALKPDGSLHFLLAGSPEGDPGLTFRQ